MEMHLAMASARVSLLSEVVSRSRQCRHMWSRVPSLQPRRLAQAAAAPTPRAAKGSYETTRAQATWAPRLLPPGSGWAGQHATLRVRGAEAAPPRAGRKGLGFLAEMETLKEQRQAGGNEGSSSLPDFEAPLEVVLYPDPRLRAPNRLVTSFDEKLQSLVEAMLDAMYRTDGVGLSAPQVGVNVRLMVYNPVGERGQGQEYVLVNPRIVKSMKATETDVEGCLSFPEINAEVQRPLGVKVDAQDARGRRFSLSLKGWQARIFQHEYDHLQGTLFFDRMEPQVLESIRPQLLRLEDEFEAKTGQKRPETVSI